MTYMIALKAEGSNPFYWYALEDLIWDGNVPNNPDSSYIPHSEVVKSLNGLAYARGYPSAVWHWDIITDENRAILRDFCPGASAEVYISTRTNEIDVSGNEVFIDCLAIMNWPTGEEDQQVDKTLGLDITFTHLVEV